MAFADDHKQLTVWSLKDKFHMIKQWNLVRRANKVLFDKSGDKILIADKSGDVFQFDMKSQDVNGQCLLGHLSMLLDLKLSKCGKFILSSDRDEKIRVSHYPNAYNIHNFCLGHEDFVTSIELLTDKYLISGSGDGTIRIWDFLNGTQLAQALCAQDAGLEPLKVDDTEQNDTKIKRMPWPAILALRLHHGEDKALIAASLEAFNGVLIYASTLEKMLQFCKKISLDGPIWDFCFIQDDHRLVVAQAVQDTYLSLLDVDNESKEVRPVSHGFFQGEAFCIPMRAYGSCKQKQRIRSNYLELSGQQNTLFQLF